MTLCSRGRSTLVLTLVFGLVTVVLAIQAVRVPKSLRVYNLPRRGETRMFFDGLVAMLARAGPVAELADHVGPGDRMKRQRVHEMVRGHVCAKRRVVGCEHVLG